MRYSLRALFLVMVVLAFLAAICFAFPPWLSNLVMAPLPMILPTVFVVGLIYGPKTARPFCIGALVPFVTEVFSASERFEKLRLVYKAVMDWTYVFVGRPHPYDRNDFSKARALEGYYLEVTFLLVVSIASGLVGYGVWLLFWKDRGDDHTEFSRR